MKQRLFIGNTFDSKVEYTQDVILPIKIEFLLDLGLNGGRVTLKDTNISTRISTGTSAWILFDETTFSDEFIISDDNVIVKTGMNLFDHELILVEATKKQERDIVDTCTTTNAIVPTYTNLETINGSYWTDNNTTQVPLGFNSGYNGIKDIKIKGSIITLYSAEHFLSVNPPFTTEPPYIAPEYWDSTSGKFYTKIYRDNVLVYENYTQFGVVNLTLNTPGVYTFEYKGTSTDSVLGSYYYSFSIAVVPESGLRTKTISDVVNKLLITTNTLRESETPKYTFDSVQDTFYSTILSPEFSFTKTTLRESLNQVGEYIHAIPHLTNGVIYFEKLGGTEEVEFVEKYISNQSNQSYEQFCAGLDSQVENITNTDNQEQGAVIEPFAGGYITPRTEDVSFRITDDTAIIETKFPIEKILRLDGGFLNDNTPCGDIAQYVVEQSTYKNLSSYQNIYPYSKAFALYYVQGSNNIYGLNFKLPNAISSAFTQYAIINILERVTGRDLSTIFSTYGMIQLQFRITYIPSTTARVRQFKNNLSGYYNLPTLIYNQSANKVDSTAYGEMLKGAVARIGNEEITKTFIYKNYADIPTVGELVDNRYYISAVDIECYSDYYKCTFGLSKDFNRLSKYIGIDKNLRRYEVSEKMVIDRYIALEDFLIIGDLPDTDIYNSNYFLSQYAISSMQKCFLNIETEITPATRATTSTYNSDDHLIQVFDLPCISYGLGNSIYIKFDFVDNYSAGNKSIGSVFNTGYERVQQALPYADYFGEMETMGIVIHRSFGSCTDYDEAILCGNSNPEFTAINISVPDEQEVINTGTDRIIVKKDNREAIKLGYQLHFITNRDNLVIGSELSKFFAFTNFSTTRNKSAVLYVLPDKLNFFADIVNLSNATLVQDYENQTSLINIFSGRLQFTNMTVPTGVFKSYVLVDSSSNKLLFGENIDLKTGDTIYMPNLTVARRKIERS